MPVLLANLSQNLDELNPSIRPTILKIIDHKINDEMNEVLQKLNHMDDRMTRQFAEIDRRFEQIDRRFEQIDKRFEQIDKRFEQIDRRFEKMEERFEKMDARFGTMDERIHSTELQTATFAQAVLQNKEISDRQFKFFCWVMAPLVTTMVGLFFKVIFS